LLNRKNFKKKLDILTCLWYNLIKIKKGEIKMLTERDKYLGVRYATEAEVKNYNLIERLLNTKSEDFTTRCIDAIGNYVTAYIPAEVHRAYNKAYYYAKKLGVTVPMLASWYFID
jgi:hypothetical protein